VDTVSGIVGILNLDGRPVDRAVVQRMMAAVAQRGPDGEGLWAEGPVGLGHRQLRATPESLGEHQPVCLQDGGYAIVCDGRVDNRRELIQALGPTAPVDERTPDAELVLRSYIAWDADCVNRIVGDFAFVIWDCLRQQLFCARDPMGIRSFYYYCDGDRFVFASEVEAILADATIPRELNQAMVARYLLGDRDEAEQTFFKDIFQISAASYLVVSRQGLSARAYWEPDPWSPLGCSKAEEYVEGFRQVFFEAVRCRVRSISPVGVSLSGGMDSTSVACTAAYLARKGELPGAKLRAYSSVFKDYPTVDESKYIQAVLDAWGLDGTYIYADELWGFKPLQNNGIRWNQPYPIPFKARHEALLTRARDSGVRVILTGEGGDELLNAGFEHLLDMFRNLQLARLYNELRVLNPQTRYQFAKQTVSHFTPKPLKRAYRRLLPRKTLAWLNEEFVRQSGALEREAIGVPEGRRLSLYSVGLYKGVLNLGRLPYLSYATEMYAYHGIEASHPFLDRRVVDFLCRVPPHMKFAGGWSKLLLRKAMEGILPDAVRLRVAKSYFSEVRDQGVLQEKARIEALLNEGYLVRMGWVNKQGIKASYDRFLAGERVWADRLLAFLTLEEWLSDYFDSNSGRAPIELHRSTLVQGERR
jgi:asparagine synthase (glutamine-hydrolysing)